MHGCLFYNKYALSSLLIKYNHRQLQTLPHGSERNIAGLYKYQREISCWQSQKYKVCFFSFLFHFLTLFAITEYSFFFFLLLYFFIYCIFLSTYCQFKGLLDEDEHQDLVQRSVSSDFTIHLCYDVYSRCCLLCSRYFGRYAPPKGLTSTYTVQSLAESTNHQRKSMKGAQLASRLAKNISLKKNRKVGVVYESM